MAEWEKESRLLWESLGSLEWERVRNRIRAAVLEGVETVKPERGGEEV